jgi:hypothetical protein
VDEAWIAKYLIFYVAVWVLIFGTSFTTREWLKKHYPCFAELWHPNDPKPTPLPTSKKKFLLSLTPIGYVLVVAFILSLLLSGPPEDGPPSRPWIDKFVLISCFMLVTVWNEIVAYFRKMVEIQGEFKIFRDAGLLSEWNKKWDDYLHPAPPGDDYDGIC